MITVIRIGIGLDIQVRTRLITFTEYQKQLCDMTLRVYSDWTRQHQIDGVKHGALVLEHMLINRSIHTGRAASNFYTIETPSIGRCRVQSE